MDTINAKIHSDGSYYFWRGNRSELASYETIGIKHNGHATSYVLLDVTVEDALACAQKRCRRAVIIKTSNGAIVASFVGDNVIVI